MHSLARREPDAASTSADKSIASLYYGPVVLYSSKPLGKTDTDWLRDNSV